MEDALTMVRRAAGTALRGSRAAAPHVRSGIAAARRQALLARVRAAAIWNDATVDIHISPDVTLGRRITVALQPWTHNVLSIGPGCIIEDDVTFQLKGGTVVLGERVDVRRGVLFNVAGRLELHGDNRVSYYTVFHCSSSITIAAMAGFGEHVTIADSSHHFTAPDEPWLHNVRPGAVSVGYNTWICPKATLTRRASVGAHCIVASNSVVVGEVPDGSIASGVPAVIKPLSLPWNQSAT